MMNVGFRPVINQKQSFKGELKLGSEHVISLMMLRQVS